MRNLRPRLINKVIPEDPNVDNYLHVEENLLREPNLWVPGKKPVGAVKVDWSNPLTHNLVTGVIGVQGGVHNFTENKIYLKNSNVVTNNGLATRVLYVDTTYQRMSENYTYDSQGANTIWIIAYYNNAWGASASLVVYPTNYTGRMQITYGTGSVDKNIYIEPTEIDGPTRTGAGTWWCNDFFVFDGTNGALYEDGIEIISPSAISPTANTQDAYLAVAPDNSPVESIDLLFGCWWDRVLSVEEVRLLSNDPYQFLVPA